MVTSYQYPQFLQTENSTSEKNTDGFFEQTDGSWENYTICRIEVGKGSDTTKAESYTPIIYAPCHVQVSANTDIRVVDCEGVVLMEGVVVSAEVTRLNQRIWVRTR